MTYFGIDIGHNCPPRDTGAVSSFGTEDNLVKLVGELVITKLKGRGHKAVEILPDSAWNVNSSLTKRANSANSLGVDYFISIHFNSFSQARANGAEIYTFSKSSSANSLAKAVLAEICNLGFFNRGLKHAGFRVLSLTKMPAMLVECCFLSSPKDMKQFDADKMATAIVDGLVGKQETVNEKGRLLVKLATLLKPSNEQSAETEKTQIFPIEPGEYEAELIAEEEGHYVVKLQNQIGGRDEHFVFAGHCEFAAN